MADGASSSIAAGNHRLPTPQNTDSHSNCAMAPDPRLKQLKIAAGVLKRVAKERQMYEKELEVEHKRLQKMKDELRDENELRQQMRVIEESAAMVPDSQRRLQAAYESLQELIQGVGESLAEDEEFKASVAALQEVCM